jgi:hypothetical protein
MRRLVPILLLGMVVAGLGSCVTAIFPSQDAILWEPVGPHSTFSLRDLTVSAKPTTGNLRQTATDLARFASRKAGLAMVDGTGTTANFDLLVSLEEREFGVDIDTYNSVSVVLKLMTPGPEGHQVGQILYSEETKKTMRSANYLEQILETTFGLLSKRIKEAR